MGLHTYSVESFDPSDLALLRRVFSDVWRELLPNVSEAGWETVKDAIAVALFDMARSGQRDPEQLWCRGIREGKRVASPSQIGIADIVRARMAVRHGP